MGATPRRPKVAIPIEPRILARMVAVRRDQQRRHRRGATIALAATVLVGGAALAARSPALAVHHLDVVSGAHTPRNAILVAAGLNGRRQMLDVDCGAIARQIGALPWVARVSVQRRWPTAVTIRITERAPAAQATGSAGQPAVVDSQGRVLATAEEAARLILHQRPTLPLLRGVGPVGAAGTNLDGATATAPTLALLRAVTGALPRTLTSVSQGGDGNLSVTLSPGPVTLLVGAGERLEAKLAVTRTLLTQVPAGASATIDVRVTEAPVLTNGQISTMVSTTQRG